MANDRYFTNSPRMSPETYAALDAMRTPCDRRGKHKHRSHGAAMAHVRSMRRRYGDGASRDGGEPEPYLCSRCGWWHTGRRPG